MGTIVLLGDVIDDGIARTATGRIISDAAYLACALDELARLSKAGKSAPLGRSDIDVGMDLDYGKLEERAGNTVNKTARGVYGDPSPRESAPKKARLVQHGPVRIGKQGKPKRW